MLPSEAIDLLEDIIDHIQYIRMDTQELTFQTFLESRTIRQAVERNLEIIGIAAGQIRNIDPELIDRIEDLKPAIALRNRLAHGYESDIDQQIIWTVVNESLPKLESQIRELI